VLLCPFRAHSIAKKPREAERWGKSGLMPSGAVIEKDRTHLRRALRFLRDVYVAVYLIKQMPRDVDAWVAQTEENPLLCDPHFHEFLDERASS
jgi:hypothetical protein